MDHAGTVTEVNVTTSSIRTAGRQRVVLRYPDGGLTFEVREASDGPAHWVPLDLADIAADLTALGWDLPDAAPPVETSVEFMQITHEGLRAWVGGRQVPAAQAVAAMCRGTAQALRSALDAFEPAS